MITLCSSMVTIISRSVIKLTGSRGNVVYEGVYSGDILLKLTHFTKHRKPTEVDVTSKIIEQGKIIINMIFCFSFIIFR